MMYHHQLKQADIHTQETFTDDFIYVSSIANPLPPLLVLLLLRVVRTRLELQNKSKKKMKATEQGNY